MQAIALISTAAIVLAAALPATAATLYRANLDQSQETTPTGSPGTGSGLVNLSDDMNSVAFSLNWTGLTAPAAAGHIHCCAPLGANAPVAIGFAPVPATSGSLFARFDLTDIGTYEGGFLAANGGTAVSARAAFLAGLDGGLAYFNIHTGNFPGGEIRGQVAGAVPEPAVWGLMIAGFGMVGGAMRRRSLASA